jgi:hypothetical protein
VVLSDLKNVVLHQLSYQIRSELGTDLKSVDSETQQHFNDGVRLTVCFSTYNFIFVVLEHTLRN